MIRKFYILAMLSILVAQPGYSMHIMEGYLPLGWSIFWYLVSLPFVVLSYRTINKVIRSDAKQRVSLALNAAFVFVLSALKLPSVTGSSSHLTGTTLGALSSGVMSMPLIGVIVLLFQALLLAHGGISTLGANVFSLAIAGPLVAYWVYALLQKIKLGRLPSVFLAAFFGSMGTYVTASLQLAVVFPDEVGGVWASFFKFMSIFALTQVPLSLLEGVMTAAVIRLIDQSSANITMTSTITLLSSRARGVMLSVGALLCLAAPIVSAYVDFGEGSDDRAGAMVETISPTYSPNPFFTTFEPSEALEPWLFVLQVLIGILLFWGAYRFIVRSSNRQAPN